MHTRVLRTLGGLVLGASLLFSAHNSALAQAFAFPGAEGWASFNYGGRYGPVIKVTNLNADGEGSLRAALEGGPSSRVVVFDVGGIIDLGGNSIVIENPSLTVAGQTAPYPGITIIDGGIEIRNTFDVIIQHIRVRPGAARHVEDGEPWEPDGISVNASSNVIIDHCSISWAVDENLSASGPRFGLEGDPPEMWGLKTSHEVTFSNNIVAEALFEATHSEGTHSRASLIHDNTYNIAVIKNLYANNNRRNPMFKAGSRGAIMNNIVYNPGQAAMYYSAQATEWQAAIAEHGPPPDARVSVVGNILQWGPNNQMGANPVPLFVIEDQFRGIEGFEDRFFLKLYLEDNLRFDHTGTLQAMIPELTDLAAPLAPPPPQYLVEEKPTWTTDLVQRPADELADYIAQNAGARPWESDPVDDRILSDWLSRTGSLINFETDVGGFPEIEPTTRPEGWDTDGDGMPNYWEEWKGTNPDGMDQNGMDVDPEFLYTNIEVYFHELSAQRKVEGPLPPADIEVAVVDGGYELVWTGLPPNGRLEQSYDLTNWEPFASGSDAGSQALELGEQDRIFIRINVLQLL